MTCFSDKKIILGSNSPRRHELMKGLDIDFTVDTGNTFEEKIDSSIEVHELPVCLSKGKSHGFHRQLVEDEVLITADTVVIVDDGSGLRVLGKPHSREEAVQMLKMLAGRTHEVVTGVTIRDCGREVSFSDSTMVTFDEVSDSEIGHYVDKFRPYDKAGAYGVQEWIGYVAISGIRGSFYNVMGFPVHKVWKELKAFL